MIYYRTAKNTDKDQILDFCKTTFEWGDYIHEVWDIWMKEKDGLLMVAVIDDELSNNKKTIAMIHGIVYDETIWVEGIRVNPQFRKKGIASEMVSKIVEYGKERNAKLASAVVSVKNNPSNELMNKLNFIPKEKWIYSTMKTINDKYLSFEKIKRAEIKDKKIIESFLARSEGINFTDKIRFVQAWRWYTLTGDLLNKIIINGQLYIYVDDKVRGIVIIDTDRYFNKANYEIGYLEGETQEIVSNLIGYCLFMANSHKSQNNKNFEIKEIINLNDLDNDFNQKMNIFCPDTKINFETLRDYEINVSSKFIVYDKKL
ncbi:MAG: GNAT family N-acetyltransferase [Nitrososphaeraceae archaeon]